MLFGLNNFLNCFDELALVEKIPEEMTLMRGISVGTNDRGNFAKRDLNKRKDRT
jgi:hypothetical protein